VRFGHQYTDFAYQWYRDGRPIAGETNQVYYSGPPDTGHRVTVKAVVSRPRYTPMTLTADGIDVTSERAVTMGYRLKDPAVSWNDGESFTRSPAVNGSTGTLIGHEAIGIDHAHELGDGLLLEYAAHVPGRGWLAEEFSSHPDLGNVGYFIAGTVGEGRQMEAYRATLTGPAAKYYDLYYRSYVRGFGWLGWARNGQASGTFGYENELSAVQMMAQPKGEPRRAPTASARAQSYDHADQRQLRVNTYLRGSGWGTAKLGGVTSGTPVAGKKVDSVRLALADEEFTGGIETRARVKDRGWTSWVPDGQQAGTPGQGVPIVAYQTRLTGVMAEHYNLYYRAYVDRWGWLGWASNGQTSGTFSYGLPVEAVQVMLVPKGDPVPVGSGKKSSYS
jgi:hypothetical protein